MGSDLLSKEEKEKILKLLEEDREFRYAVAGLIGLDEILRRLDRHEEQIVKIWERLAKIDEEIAKLREDMNRGFERHDKEFEKVWNEIAKLREDMMKGFERHDKEFEKIWSEIAKLREDMLRGFERHDKEFERVWNEIAKLREEMVKGFERHDAELAKLREDMIKGFERYDQYFAKVWNEIAMLREDLNNLRRDFLKMAERVDKMDERLSRVERTLEKLTLDIEEEARSIVRHRIRSEIGLDVEISSLHLPDMEVNIYGCKDDVCVVGEASVRAGVNLLKELLDKVEELKKRYPDKLGKKMILVIYTSLAMPELVEEAKKYGVWVLKATGDYYKPNLAEILSQ